MAVSLWLLFHSTCDFIMLNKPVSTCYLCRHDRVLKLLKDKVSEIQIEMRVEWKSSPVIQVTDHLERDDMTKDNWFLINAKEQPSVIPSYGSYDKIWKRALFLNPLEVDWLLFEIHGSDDVDYVSSLVEVLVDQRELWSGDEDTLVLPIMVLFSRFISAIKRLLLYSLNSSNLTY